MIREHEAQKAVTSQMSTQLFKGLSHTGLSLLLFILPLQDKTFAG